MLTKDSNRKIYLASGYTDLRKSIDGLAAIVQLNFKLNPFDNAYFVFCGKSRNKVKILNWEGNGFALYYKRLEEGRIKWPSQGEVLTITSNELNWLINGITVITKQQSKLGNVKHTY